MTLTLTDPRPPSPADLAATSPAARRAAERLAALLAPARLADGDRFRVEYTRAVCASGMTPNTRLVALVLASHGNYRTGHIPTRLQPRLQGLAEGTGLAVPQVVVALRALEQRGWVSCTGGRDYDRGDLRPHIPQHAVTTLRRRAPKNGK
ncbi:hypothetical protein [uncultured Streptomyces sp.]|uniref:hypothetical protein n=1 Tax=uncultured Streptomyces sp. TaxID=174707 RepID=UPI0026070747|nr:hypothetical protein [uncultured Streptomyces sp.]